MKNRLFLLSLITVLWVSGCQTPSSATSGNSSQNEGIQTFSGSLTLGQYKDYKISVKANQLLNVSMEAYNKDCRFAIISPEGKHIFWSNMAGDNFSGIMNVEGTYRIRVTLSNTGSETQRANYTVKYTLQ